MSRAHVRTTATLSLAVSLVPLAMGLGACSSSPPPSPPAQGAAAVVRPDSRADAGPLLTSLLARVNQAGSARSAVRGSLGLVGELNGEGTVRYRGERADVALGGTTQPSKTQPRQPVEVSVVDGVGYLKSPLLRPEPGKPWLKITSEGQDFAAKLLSPALEQLQDSTDPRATFAGIEPATKIQSSTADQVDGRRATRYELRVLTARAVATASDPQQRTRLRQAADSGKAELGYQLWVDEAGLPARFAATQEVARAGQVSLTSTYRDWGVTTEIQPPPQEQVGVFRDLPAPQAQLPPR